jgi:TolB protein
LQLIYQQEPDYRDVKTRLQQALRAQSQALADAEEWCQAATVLSELIAIGVTPGIVAQREVYQAACTTGATTADADAGTPTTPGTGTPDAEGTTTPTRLATTTAATGAPTTGTILYSANDLASGRSRILAQAVGGSSPALLREEASQPALRADGSRLLYRNLRNDMAGISAWDQENDLLLRFTQYAEDSLPSWSAQGNQFAFASNREGDRLWRVYVAWAESGSEATVLSIGEAPAWHPTADVIVFRGCDNSGNRCGLWQINSRGSDRTPLTDIPTDNRPAWSPDGRYVVFMSEGRNGNFEIYRVETSTGQVLPLTDHPTPDVLPTVSPDGRWVAFLSNRDGSWKIWAVPIGGGTATAIAPVAGNLGSWTEQALQWVP